MEADRLHRFRGRQAGGRAGTTRCTGETDDSCSANARVLPDVAALEALGALDAVDPTRRVAGLEVATTTVLADHHGLP